MNRLVPVALAVLSAAAAPSARAQTMAPVGDYAAPPGAGNVHVAPVDSDSLASVFVITVREEVRLHRHNLHAETVYVVSGEGYMRLGDENRNLEPGDVVFIPRGVPHGVDVTSMEPMVVVSVQSPRFDGADRVWLED